jgi:hypothetical protein
VIDDSSSSGQKQPTRIDTSTPHTARVWNYWLGGKDNYTADREAGDQVEALIPGIVNSARANRAFLGRAVRYLVADAGIRQFLDVGTGIPTANNTHEVAQSIAPESRIVYVDNDPIVLVHARALLVGSPQGVTDYIEADARDPEKILQEAARTLDFEQPIAVMMLGILNHIVDDEQAHAIVNRLLDAVPSGSYLVIGHPTAEVHGEAMEESMRLWNERGGTPIKSRNRHELAAFFDRLELLEPGVVSCSQWRPGPDEEIREMVSEFCAVGRKP